MEQHEKVRLAEIMARMAEGDHAAAITLYFEFGSYIETRVARMARAQGATHLTREDILAMTMDVCLDLLPRAGSWDPDGGALPWVWAERRLVAIVGDYIGRYGTSLDEELHGDRGDGDVAPPERDLGEDEALAHLADRDPTCALLQEALGLVTTSLRNLRVVLLFEVQRASGDPSPAVTVADELGMRPDAVRKVVQRTKDGVVRLAAREDRFAPLVALPFLHRSRAA